MSIDLTPNAAHQAVAYSSEARRQTDQAFAQALWGGLQGADPIAEITTASRAAEISHYRRLLASAIANGANPTPYMDGLRTLGIFGMYG